MEHAARNRNAARGSRELAIGRLRVGLRSTWNRATCESRDRGGGGSDGPGSHGAPRALHEARASTKWQP